MELNKNEWIPINFDNNEEHINNNPLPKAGQEILITTIDGIVRQTVCCEDEDGLYLLYENDWLNVVAWMPIPEPYHANNTK